MFSLILASTFIHSVLCDDLLSVVVIYRHGDRTPVAPYPTDPYKNASYWPVDFGQLTNLGKMQHFLLGKWLRSRYDGFLPSRYSEKDVYVRSTDVDRTLMSAEANLAGLFPPKDDQVWEPSIPWQPIPVHTTQLAEDDLLAMSKGCPKYDLLMEQLMKSDYFVNISRQNQDLYEYLTENTGVTIESLADAEYLYNTLFIEELYNYTLPDWTKSVYPDRLKPLAELSFATLTFTEDLARLESGPLFGEIVDHFYNFTTNGTGLPKFVAFSAHDVTIANVLNTMGAFQYHCPPYASTVIFELKRNAESAAYVNIFYKNSSIVQNVNLKGCAFDCSLEDFIAILKPVLISPQERDYECQLAWYDSLRLDAVQYVIYIGAAFSFLICTLSICWVCKCRRKNPKGDLSAYTMLPNDEVA